MKLQYITFIIGILMGLIVGLFTAHHDLDHTREELLTGKVLCKVEKYDENNQPKFKCKTRKEIDEVVNFLRGGNPNDQRQESR